MAIWNMAAVYGERLVGINVPTTGLTMYVDAGNSASYPGSGSTWYDLSGKNNNMTLGNGPTYSSQYGGVLTFTPSQTAVSGLNYSTSSFSIISAQRYTGGSNGRGTAGVNNNWLFGLYAGYNEAYYANGWIYYGAYGADTNWRIFSGTENYSADQRSFYVNNVAKATNSTAGSSGFNGLSINSNPYNETSNCQVSFICVYDRVLSTAELTTVYNAFKGRFGLS